ncbi:hypothetical protein J7649_16715 (plasmid) [Acinetobacter lwoffii]|jgi:hypothetical protein|uniref:hypothetical protein n=1 Tax=Acinetobacter lwoffii TaxID=28090 RepID=UPI001C5BAAE9|nr:hypothetical protein [Acinetobacter lwoffii]QXX88350.1 hypothetical protein J7649_16715 [Acinetobacter lwoffii]
MDYEFIMLSISIIFGFLSAGAWFYSSQVKVTREKALEIAKKKAQKNKEQPNLSGVSFDGWDVRETLKAQSKWNSLGAIFASISMFLQGLISIFY